MKTNFILIPCVLILSACSTLKENRAYYVDSLEKKMDYTICGPHRYGDKIIFKSGAESLEAYFQSVDGPVFLGFPLVPIVPMQFSFAKELKLRIRPSGKNVSYDISKIKVSIDGGKRWAIAAPSILTKEECLRRRTKEFLLDSCANEKTPDQQTLEFGPEIRAKLNSSDSLLLSIENVKIDGKDLPKQMIHFYREQKWNYSPLAINQDSETEFNPPCHYF